MTPSSEQQQSFRNAVVWVTGASGGIGAAICDAFAEAGASVIGTDLLASARTPTVRTLACDVSSPTDIDRIIAECEAAGGVDVLVNCAGVLRRANVLEVTAESWEQIFAINVKGAFLCAQAAARSMIARKRKGSIVNIGSVNAEKVFADSVAYCSSKGALHAMSRAMALALAPYRIRVNTVAPGAIADTGLELARWGIEAERDAMRARTPLGVLGTAADIAPSVLFLSSRHADFITGATLFVDGGRTASV